MGFRRRAVLFAALLSLTSTWGAEAQQPEVQWQQEQWSSVRPAEYVAAGALGLAAVAVRLAVVPDVERWRGGVLFDEPFRNALAVSSPDAREGLALASDVLKWGGIAQALVLDPWLVAAGLHNDVEVGWNMFWISGLSFVSTAAVLFATKNLVARGRPYVRDCEEGSGEKRCYASDRFRSFFSGHAAFAFTAAGATCAHHYSLPLYGDENLDRGACFAALGIASVTALLRVLADKHYTTDVLTGALIGLASGFLLPSALHYGHLGL